MADEDRKPEVQFERPMPRNNRPLRPEPKAEEAKAPEVTPKVTEAPPVVEKVTETSRTAAEMEVGRQRLEHHKKLAELREAAAKLAEAEQAEKAE